MLKIVVSFLCYFYYNDRFFHYLSKQSDRKIPVWKSAIVPLILNFGVFMLCSYLGLHLILNWSLFALILFLETWFIFRFSPSQSFFHGLIGAFTGLGANVCLRSVVAILMNVPPSAFNNNVNDSNNLKIYPVALGFLVSGLLFHLISGPVWGRMIRAVCQDKESLKFVIRLILALYAYLCLNLLIYYIPENKFLLKLFGIKSSLCAFAGLFTALHYTYKTCQLNRYREQAEQVREELVVHKRNTENLSSMAQIDSLTGCYSRGYGEEMLETALQEETLFCLCFVDLNRLKTVNDTLGHQTGNRYLTAITYSLRGVCDSEKGDFLCRYGGDEFLLFLKNTNVQEAEKTFLTIHHDLQKQSHTSEYPFTLSISVGFAERGEAESMEALIRLADQRMYQNKSAQR